MSLRREEPPTRRSMKSEELNIEKSSCAACNLTLAVGRRRGASPWRPWIRWVAAKVSRGMMSTGVPTTSRPARIACTDSGSVSLLPPVSSTPAIFGKACDLLAMRRERSTSMREMCVTTSGALPGMGSSWRRERRRRNSWNVILPVPSLSSSAMTLCSSKSVISRPITRISVPTSSRRILPLCSLSNFLNSAFSSWIWLRVTFWCPPSSSTLFARIYLSKSGTCIVATTRRPTW
mmetsp:Transcript_6527/g.15301  ORF Transcript_6527/g.15301 Transcript_6527/m.15301 type:complete len:234 (-) Transcript_6527:214-915(-)